MYLCICPIIVFRQSQYVHLRLCPIVFCQSQYVCVCALHFAPGTLSRLWWCCELSGPDALLLDVHRLEGFAMGRGLVSADEGIRREALQVRT